MMAETLKDLKVKIKLDNREFNNGVQGVQKECSSLTATVKKVGTAIAGAFVVKKVVEFGTAIAKVGVEYNALQEQSKVTWTTLLGSQEEAISQLERIEKFAASTPFSKMGVDQMAKYLHNAGYEGDEVFKTLSKIGDMGSAFGLQEDSLVELTRQFSQVQQAGYAYTEDLNILADRGIPIYKAIAEEVGVTVAEVKKMASEGKLTTEIYNKAIDSMAKTTEGAMDAQSKTFNGMISTLEDNLTSLAGLLTEKLFNALSSVLSVILPLVESFTVAYKETGSLKEAFKAILPQIESMGIKLDGVRVAWGVFSKFLSNTYHSMIAPLIDGFIELTNDMGDKFVESSDKIINTFELLGGVISGIWSSAIQPVWDLFLDCIFDIWELFNENITNIIDLWGAFPKFLSDTYHSMIAPLIDGFIELTNDMREKFVESSDDMMSYFDSLGSVISDVWSSVIQPAWDLFLDYIFTIWDLFNENITNVMDLWNTVAEAIKLAWTSILKPVFERVMEWVGKVFDKFKEYMPQIQCVVDEVFEEIQNFWENGLKPAFEAIGAFLQNVLLPIFDVIFTYGILPVVQTVFQTIIKLWDSSLKPAFQGITDFIRGVFTLNWTTAWNGLSKIFSGVFNGLVTIARAPLNSIINMVNSVIGSLNKIKLPDWVPGVGGKGINIPQIPTLWKGSNYTMGGLTLVGEQGPELVSMPRGASVTPAHKTEQILGTTNMTPQQVSIVVQTTLDGKVLAETVTPYTDIVSGNRLNLSKRGVLV